LLKLFGGFSKLIKIMKAIDLFCGCGGFSLGAVGSGIDILYAADAEPRHAEVYAKNHPDTIVETLDVKTLTGDYIRQVTGEQTVDLVLGGSPCQGFSVAGRRDPDDPRNSLLFEVPRLAIELESSYFVIENVPAIVSARDGWFLKQLVKYARSNGYEIMLPIRIAIASNYGVPQRRKRLFVLGYKQGIMPPRYPEPSPDLETTSVGEAFSDLPDPIPEGAIGDSPFFRYARGRDRYARRLYEAFPDPLEPHVPPFGDRPVTHHVLTRHERETIERFRQLAPGDTDRATRHRKLFRDRPAFTLRAGTRNQTALRPVHPTQPRVITVREAARLHSYPDWYEFDETKVFGYMQIGNSVCPLQAKAIFDVFINL